MLNICCFQGLMDCWLDKISNMMSLWPLEICDKNLFTIFLLNPLIVKIICRLRAPIQTAKTLKHLLQSRPSSITLYSMTAFLLKRKKRTKTGFKQQLTFMHIHMEMGRVITMRIMESRTKAQPQNPMSDSWFSKARREDKHRNKTQIKANHLWGCINTNRI